MSRVRYGSYLAACSGAIVVRDADVEKDPCPKGAHFVWRIDALFLRFTGGYGMHAGLSRVTGPRTDASACPRTWRSTSSMRPALERVEVIEPPLKVVE
jgi:hypothetical protein